MIIAQLDLGNMYYSNTNGQQLLPNAPAAWGSHGGDEAPFARLSLCLHAIIMMSE